MASFPYVSGHSQHSLLAVPCRTFCRCKMSQPTRPAAHAAGHPAPATLCSSKSNQEADHNPLRSLISRPVSAGSATATANLPVSVSVPVSVSMHTKTPARTRLRLLRFVRCFSKLEDTPRQASADPAASVATVPTISTRSAPHTLIMRVCLQPCARLLCSKSAVADPPRRLHPVPSASTLAASSRTSSDSDGQGAGQAAAQFALHACCVADTYRSSWSQCSPPRPNSPADKPSRPPLLLPIPIRRTIRDGPRGPVVEPPGLQRNPAVSSLAGLTPSACEPTSSGLASAAIVSASPCLPPQCGVPAPCSCLPLAGAPSLCPRPPPTRPCPPSRQHREVSHTASGCCSGGLSTSCVALQSAASLGYPACAATWRRPTACSTPACFGRLPPHRATCSNASCDNDAQNSDPSPAWGNQLAVLSPP